MLINELFDNSESLDTELVYTSEKYDEGVLTSNYWFLAGDENEQRWYCLTIEPGYLFTDKTKYSSLSFSAILTREVDSSKFLGFKVRKLGTKKDPKYMDLKGPAKRGSTKLAIQVWATASKCLMEFIIKIRPNCVYFSGTSDSRQKFYETGIKRLIPDLKAIGYVVKFHDDTIFITKRIIT